MKIWMVADKQRGCPRSRTILIPGKTDNDGRPLAYTFVRDRATEVADADVEFILAQTVVDKHNYPMNVFRKEPPRQELNDADRMRMQLESQQSKIEGLEELLSTLVQNNPEMAAKLDGGKSSLRSQLAGDNLL